MSQIPLKEWLSSLKPGEDVRLALRVEDGNTYKSKRTVVAIAKTINLKHTSGQTYEADPETGKVEYAGDIGAIGPWTEADQSMWDKRYKELSHACEFLAKELSQAETLVNKRTLKHLLDENEEARKQMWLVQKPRKSRKGGNSQHLEQAVSRNFNSDNILESYFDDTAAGRYG